VRLRLAHERKPSHCQAAHGSLRARTHRSRSPTARVLCNMHSATLQPALIKRSPSMVSQHAAGGGSGGGGSGAATKLHVAAAELTAAAQASAPAAAAARTLAATQVLAKLCGALCGALSAHSALLLHLQRIISPPAAAAHLAERRQQLPARCALTRAAVSRRRKAQELEQGSKESQWNSMATPWACGSWRGVLMGKGASWGGRVSRFEPPSVRLDTSSRE